MNKKNREPLFGMTRQSLCQALEGMLWRTKQIFWSLILKHFAFNFKPTAVLHHRLFRNLYRIGTDNRMVATESCRIDCFRSNHARRVTNIQKSVKIPISSTFASKIAEHQFFLQLGRGFVFDSSAFDKLFNDSFRSMKQMHRVSLRHVLILSWRESVTCLGVRVKWLQRKMEIIAVWRHFRALELISDHWTSPDD